MFLPTETEQATAAFWRYPRTVTLGLLALSLIVAAGGALYAWMGSRNGIFFVPKQAFDDLDAGRIERIGRPLLLYPDSLRVVWPEGRPGTPGQ